MIVYDSLRLGGECWYWISDCYNTHRDTKASPQIGVMKALSIFPGEADQQIL